MHTRGWSSAAVALLATASLGGCGGSDAEPPEGPSQTATSATGDYLPVPDAVTLTEAGAELSFRDAAVAAWLPRQDVVGVVDVTVDRVVVSTVKKSLSGFRLSKEARKATPYFVQTEVTNVGETDLGARQLPFYVVDSRGRLIAPTGVAPDFEPCAGSTLPETFAPGDETTSCLIFLVPEGEELQSVMFRPPEGIAPLLWNGEPTKAGGGTTPQQGSGTKADKKAGKKSGTGAAAPTPSPTS